MTWDLDLVKQHDDFKIVNTITTLHVAPTFLQASNKYVPELQAK
jgi:hypothetical protein